MDKSKDVDGERENDFEIDMKESQMGIYSYTHIYMCVYTYCLA